MNHIVKSRQGDVAFVTMDRQEVLNAFNYGMVCELEEVVQLLSKASDVRVVVFTGAGDRAFSVGADLKERKRLTDQEVRRNVDKIQEVFGQIDKLSQPTIAAINGHAFGGGLELALACDFRIAAKDVLMGLTETSLAIIPGAGGTQRLPRLIGEAKALEFILTAKRLSAVEAYQAGLVTKIVERAQLNDAVMEWAKAISANGPIAVRQAKYAIKAGMDTDLKTGLEIESKAYEETIRTEDRVEALAAFSEKRKPLFKGR